jgi:hypothetical protein
MSMEFLEKASLSSPYSKCGNLYLLCSSPPPFIMPAVRIRLGPNRAEAIEILHIAKSASACQCSGMPVFLVRMFSQQVCICVYKESLTTLHILDIQHVNSNATCSEYEASHPRRSCEFVIKNAFKLSDGWLIIDNSSTPTFYQLHV